MKWLSGWFFGFAIVAMLSPSLNAQQGSGASLQVTAADELGGVLVGATITLVQDPDGKLWEATTNDAGEVTFDGLSRGEYTLSASSPGFRDLKRQVTIGSGTPRPIELQMIIEVTQVVEVEALEHPLPERQNPDDNADQIDVDDDVLNGVPLQMGGDRVISFLSRFLSPAAGETSIVVDGQEVRRMNLPAHAIESIVVNKNPYSAEYRKPGRARIEVVAQNGSGSHHHGDGTFVATSSRLSAKDPFANEKPDFSQWQGEMGFSGPLRNTKGSYLFAAELSGMHTFGAVNALTLGGPVAELVPEQERESYWTGRLDLEPTDRLELTFRYEFDDKIERNSTVGGLALAELGIDHDTVQHDLWLEANHILTPNFVHRPLIRFGYGTETEGNAPTAPLVIVEGAFEGGTNQRFTDASLFDVDIQDVATYHHNAHTLQFGGKFNPQFIRTNDLTNFGGTYEFSNLDLYAAGRPFAFHINQGDPALSYSMQTAEAHFEDEIKLRQDLTLMMGLRYDWESVISSDTNNFAPRVALSYAPGIRTWAFRGGAGVFYQRLGSKGYEQVALYGGDRIQSLVYLNPAYPDAAAGGGATLATPSVYRFDPSISSPYMAQASVAVDRQFGEDTSLSVEYIHLRGFNLFRVRDLNAPLPGSGQRPDPSYQNVIQIESAGKMTSNSIQVTLNGDLFNDLEGTAVYTYSRTYDDTPGVDKAGKLSLQLPFNSYDPSQEWGRSDFDLRHRFSLAAVYDGFPGDVELGAILDLTSGEPYEITTGFDDNGDGIANDRPAGVPRNAGNGPRFASLDLRLKKILLTPRPLRYPQADPGELELYIDAFNVINRVNYKSINGVLSSPRFGLPTRANKGRLIQAGLTWSF